MALTRAGSIRSRLTLVFSILLLPLVAYMVLVGWSDTEEQTAHVRETVRYLAEIASKYERNLFSGTELLFTGLAEQPEIRIGGAICDEDLQRVVRALPDYRSISVVDAAGAITCSNQPGRKGTSIADKDYFADLLTRARSFAIGSSSKADARVRVQSWSVSNRAALAQCRWARSQAAIVADINLPNRSTRMSAGARTCPPIPAILPVRPARNAVELAGHPDLPA